MRQQLDDPDRLQPVCDRSRHFDPSTSTTSPAAPTTTVTTQSPPTTTVTPVARPTATIAVITAGDRELPAGLAASEVARLTEAWNQGQQAWASLSSTAHVVTVDHTGHHIEIDQPAVVIDEITRLLP
jgi:hypothetical protein